MNFEHASSVLSAQIMGAVRPAKDKDGVALIVPGLQELVQRQPPSPDRDRAMVQCGVILGFAAMLGGLKEKG